MRSTLHMMLLAGLHFAVVFAGCGEAAPIEVEPLHADDQLNESDIRQFLAVVDDLPEKKAPALPALFLPSPRWNRSRTLPVNELLDEAQRQSAERGSFEWLASHLPQSRALNRALRRHELSREQFVGLYIALGVALGRDALPLAREPEQLLNQGNKALEILKHDSRLFASLPDDAAFVVQEQAEWMAVVQRCTWLKMVPAENLALVREHRNQLKEALPAEFSRNPLEEFDRIIDDQGIPFRDTPGELSDDGIRWLRSEALAGAESLVEPPRVLPTPVAIPIE